MGLSLVQSRALLGLEAVQVTVEVHMANGLPSFTLVGLADVEVKEARERVRCAIQNSGLEFPHNKRITVNLAPADLPKDSGRLDLPIALGILAASGQIEAYRLAEYEFAGELSLSGGLRPVRGALAMALALHQAKVHTSLVLPPDSAQEAALVPGAQVYMARSLIDVVRQFMPEGTQPPIAQAGSGAAEEGWVRVQGASPGGASELPDMADVKGQLAAKRALEIAAAGGHSLLLVGPPGAGKSMLAQRFAGLLPPMDTDQALQSAAIASLSGRFDIRRWGQRPTCSPHHSASAVALVGGGSPPRPGEISLAHHGVLFLDELPEFPRQALEALREPLETGSITIARAHESLPLRLLGGAGSQLPLHARPDQPLPGQAQRPAHGSYRLACGSASAGQRRFAAGRCRRGHAQHPRALQPGLGAGARQAGQKQPDPGRAGNRPACAFGIGCDQVFAKRSAATRLVRARHPSHPQNCAHDCRPGRLRQHGAGPCRRSHAVPPNAQKCLSAGQERNLRQC